MNFEKNGDKLSWEGAKQVTKAMLTNLKPLTPEVIDSLDAQDGIYIVTYDGSALGFGLMNQEEEKIVYVGVSKFNSSRHFKSGTTGTSTLRRSLGALLSARLELLPIPRSNDPEDADRFDNYAFESQSEDNLTDWMVNNFKVSYLKLDKENIQPFYLGLIAYNVPIFNFQNNPDNKYGAQIKDARRKMAAEAAKHAE